MGWHSERPVWRVGPHGRLGLWGEMEVRWAVRVLGLTNWPAAIRAVQAGQLVGLG